jgi:hypothetical protein
MIEWKHSVAKKRIAQRTDSLTLYLVLPITLLPGRLCIQRIEIKHFVMLRVTVHSTGLVGSLSSVRPSTSREQQRSEESCMIPTKS